MKFLRYFLPVAILAVCGYFAWVLLSARPEPPKSNRNAFAPEVEVTPLQPQNYQIILRSQGIIEARTQSALIPEVRGRIIHVSPSFRPGGFFEKGELLVQIDASDYETELVVADATLAQMELRYAEEKVRADRAVLDWQRLGNQGDAPELVLRLPQMRQAEANLASAQARVKAAHLNLERTRITAPYAGRVLKQNADVGQYVSPGNQLANLYATDFAEVRLPLSEAQLGFITLPESYRDAEASANLSQSVKLTAKTGEISSSWDGQLVRAEGAFDQRSRQLYVVAQVKDPYASTDDGRPPLKVGTFVEAQIQGTLLQNVFVIPRRLFRESDYIILIDSENLLRRRSVTPIWSDETNIVVRQNIQPGERLCLTPIKYPTTGMSVVVKQIDDKSLARDAAQIPRLEAALKAIPDNVKLPVYLSVEIDSVLKEQDAKRVETLLYEIRRWARNSDIQIPEAAFKKAKPENKTAAES